MLDKISGELSEHFGIPCDLCNKYFCKDGTCPSEVTQCGDSEHWKMLLERICDNEKD